MIAVLDERLQSELRESAARTDVVPSPIFILGAPRTGSTFFYQLLVTAFGLPYFSNVVNDHFAESPLVGLWLQSAGAAKRVIEQRSSYGKSHGLFQPSEASAVMRHWFGGGHPSQSVSARVLPGREDHLMATLSAAERLFGRPLVIKNAWNCFRIEYLSTVLRGATFIWIKRDIRSAASSDLAARYAVHGSPHTWNSATPSNLEELRKCPYVEQVLENQYEFNLAIELGLNALPSERWSSVWYEDLCETPASELERIAGALPVLGRLETFEVLVSDEKRKSRFGLSEADFRGIVEHAGNSRDRFEEMFHRSWK